MDILRPESVRHDDILLFLCDDAPFMVIVGKSLKYILYENDSR